MSKISYKPIYYPLNLEGDSSLKTGDKVELDQKIFFDSSKKEIKEYVINGKPLVAVGDAVTIGTSLYKTGKFKKTEFKSDVEGEVKEITKTTISIEVPITEVEENTEEKKDNFQIIPISGSIKSLRKNTLLIEATGTEINLVLSKGSSVIASIVYIDDIEKFCAEPDTSKVAGKIVFTPKFNFEYYSTLSAFNAKAIVSLHTDYAQTQEIAMAATSFAVVFGFGDLKIDSLVTDYISKLETKIGWLDTTYNRFVIFDKDKPVFIDQFQFDVDKMLEI